MIKPQLHLGKLHPLEKIHHPIKNYIQCKAIGGVYTSTYMGKELGSAWLQWCLCNEFNLPKDNIWKGWIMEVKEDANIFVVDSIEDMHFLYDRYSFQLIEGYDVPHLNIELMQEDYDGLQITAHGEAVTRHPSMFDFEMVDRKKRMRSMYGWDIESTHFFRNVFKDVKEIELKIEPLEHENW
jgi:hypothetical protein